MSKFAADYFDTPKLNIVQFRQKQNVVSFSKKIVRSLGMEDLKLPEGMKMPPGGMPSMDKIKEMMEKMAGARADGKLDPKMAGMFDQIQSMMPMLDKMKKEGKLPPSLDRKNGMDDMPDPDHMDPDMKDGKMPSSEKIDEMMAKMAGAKAAGNLDPKMAGLYEMMEKMMPMLNKAKNMKKTGPNASGTTQDEKVSQLEAGPFNEVIEIESLDQLQKLIKQKEGVAVYYWARSSGPCRIIKPIFEQKCHENTNQAMSFCTVNVEKVTEATVHYKAKATTADFYLKGEQHWHKVEPNEEEWKAQLETITKLAVYTKPVPVLKNKVVLVKSAAQLKNMICDVPGLVVAFAASWCKKSLKFKAEMRHICKKNKNANITFCRVQIDELTDIAKEYGVTDTPDVRFYHQEDEMKKLIDPSDEEFEKVVKDLSDKNAFNPDELD